MRLAPRLVVVAVAAGAAAPRAHAGDDGDEARRLAARAQAHYDLGEYEDAIAEYRAAYRLVPSPGLLYNLGQAHRLAGDCAGATTVYRSYLRLAPRSPYRKLVRRHLAALSTCPVAATVERPRRARARTPGHDRKVAGIATGAGGVALVLAGSAFATGAAADSGEERKQDDREPDRGAGRTTGAVLLIAGGTALVAGATLYALGWRADRRASSLQLAPVDQGASLTVSWAF